MKPLPDPPIGPEINVRHIPDMPLAVARLRTSDTAGLANGDEFRAAVLLWAAAWHQVPAGSVPQGDALLAHLAGFGRDVDAWLKVADNALRGFVLCSDGRYYHAVIIEKAIGALEAERDARAAADWRHERARKAARTRWSIRDNPPTPDAIAMPKQSSSNAIASHAGEPAHAPSSGSTSPDTLPLIHPLATPDPKPPKSGNGTRLAADWTLTAEWRDAAVKACADRGVPVPDLDRCAVDFATHFHAKAGADARKADWRLTWLRWVRTEGDRIAERVNGRHGPGLPAPTPTPAGPSMKLSSNTVRRHIDEVYGPGSGDWVMQIASKLHQIGRPADDLKIRKTFRLGPEASYSAALAYAEELAMPPPVA